MGRLKADRLVQAKRLGEACKELYPASDDVVAMLCEDEIDEQWPNAADYGDDVPPEVSAPSVLTAEVAGQDVTISGGDHAARLAFASCRPTPSPRASRATRRRRRRPSARTSSTIAT